MRDTTAWRRFCGLAAAYAAMITTAAAAIAVISRYGGSLGAEAPAGAVVPAANGPRVDVLFHVLLVLLSVIVVGRIFSKICRHLHQPPVIGEMLAGIALGPSLLGRVSPEALTFLLPPQVAPFVAVLAQIGVILYMFLVGLELNVGALRARAHTTVLISHTSIVVPFVLGATVALGLYPRFAAPEVPFTSFALFLGVAMSITAFPVLARILADRGLMDTPIGALAVACAAADDVTAWCLLAFVIGFAQAQIGSAVVTLLLTAAFIALMFLVARPMLARLGRMGTGSAAPSGMIAVALATLLASALTTEAIGIHAIFGAFLFGAMLPHDGPLARELSRRIHDLVAIVLLPAFFALTGMRTEIGLLSGTEAWGFCALVVAMATLGKFGGSVAAARLTGLGWFEGAQVGVLMNTRGLMELIVLNIGLDLHILSPVVFAMMVIMAIVTTVAATPVLDALRRARPSGERRELVPFPDGYSSNGPGARIHDPSGVRPGGW